MSINPELLAHYRRSRGSGRRAVDCLATARRLLEKGEKCYCSRWIWQGGAGNVSRQTKERPGDNYAWIENTSTAGLRFVGFADEIAGRAIEHKGWYINESEDETYRGAVWQLPGRNGRARFIAGYADPNNEGAAFVSLDIIEGDKGEDGAEEAKREAARQGDEIARIRAEREWEYSEQWQAGSRWSDLGEEIKTERREIIELCKEARRARQEDVASRYPETYKELKNAICRALKTIQKARKKRQELFENYGTTAGFADHL